MLVHSDEYLFRNNLVVESYHEKLYAGDQLSLLEVQDQNLFLLLSYRYSRHQDLYLNTEQAPFEFILLCSTHVRLLL